MADAPREQEGLPEEEMANLMQTVSAVAPLLKGFLAPSAGISTQGESPAPHGGGREDYCKRREGLLLALKPYLSPARCEAIDYLIRLSRVGDAIRNLQ